MRLVRDFCVFCLVFAVCATWVFSGWPQVWQNPQAPPEVQKAQAGIGSSLAALSGSSFSFTAETVGGSDAHALVLTNPGGTADYKWQFLTNGVRLFIDRNDGSGWVQLISEIRTAPEYLKRQGGPTNCVWNSYGLNVTTLGLDVLQGWDKQVQLDGSVDMVRTQDGFEEGILEILTSTWTIPASAEELGAQGPKASFQMTKNRGIVTDGSCEEGTWRMKWELSGIADITTDNLDILDADGYAIRKKAYSGNEFIIDVNDFDNALSTGTALHTFSEIGTNNKAEVLFFKDGTVGNRQVDPTTVVTAGPGGWGHNTKRVAFYNGTDFFLGYGDGTDTFYQASSDNSTWSASSTLVSSANLVSIYVVNDAKFDFAYVSGTDTLVRTCTISGQTITCGTASTVAAEASDETSVARSVNADRIFVGRRVGGRVKVSSADQTGDAEGVSAWTEETNANVSAAGNIDAVPFNDSGNDKVLSLYQRDAGGTINDGIYSVVVTRGAGNSTPVELGNRDNFTDTDFGNGVRVSDTDFRFVMQDTTSGNTGVWEYKFDGSSWSALEQISASTNVLEPSLFYDTISGDSYVFAINTGANPDSVVRSKKQSGGSWEAAVAADDAEGDDRSRPITQMHEPPLGSSRTTPRQLVWAYRVANGANFDLKFGNLELAAAANVSITVDDGTVAYGTLAAGATQDTFTIPDRQIVTNTGDVSILLNIKGAATSDPDLWALVATAGTDEFRHRYASDDAGTTWVALTDSYQLLTENIAAGTTAPLDLEIQVPTSTSATSTQTNTVTVQAVQE